MGDGKMQLAVPTQHQPSVAPRAVMAALAAALLLVGVVLLASGDINHASASITPTALKGQTTELPENCIPDGQSLGAQYPSDTGPRLCHIKDFRAQTGKSNPGACCSGNCYTSGYSSAQPHYPSYNCGTCNNPNGCAD